MNALADKVHKQGMPHVICTCTQWMAPLFNNHPTYVAVAHLLMQEWLLNNVAMLWSYCTCISHVEFLVCVLCQPVHSLSLPYISQIAFQKYFYGDNYAPDSADYAPDSADSQVYLANMHVKQYNIICHDDNKSLQLSCYQWLAAQTFDKEDHNMTRHTKTCNYLLVTAANHKCQI